VVAALQGAVIGGGLELASATHIRVADDTAFYQMPEGRRGIFIGGGGSVHLARIIGAGRMVEMMLTGRVFNADAGERLGLSHYLVAKGKALGKAIELAELVAGNAPIPNWLVIQALPRIADMASADGLWTESIAQALSLTSEDAREGMKAFLERRKIDFGG
jgi:enoyl-CoA hydratase/carnithine racemase